MKFRKKKCLFNGSLSPIWAIVYIPLLLSVHCGKGPGGGSGGIGSIVGGILNISLLGTAPVSQTSSPNTATISTPVTVGFIRIPNTGIEIHLEASAPLNPQTVNTGTFVLYENGNALANNLYFVNLYDQDTKVKITPDYNSGFQFQDDKFYKLEITKDVSGTSGETLQANLNFEFEAPTTLQNIQLVSQEPVSDGLPNAVRLATTGINDGTLFEIEIVSPQGVEFYQGHRVLGSKTNVAVQNQELSFEVASLPRQAGLVRLSLKSSDGFFKGTFRLAFGYTCPLQQLSGLLTASPDPKTTNTSDYMKDVVYFPSPLYPVGTLDPVSAIIPRVASLAFKKDTLDLFGFYAGDTECPGGCPIFELQGDCTQLSITNADLTTPNLTWLQRINPHHGDPDGIRFTEDGLFVTGTNQIQHYNSSLIPDANGGYAGNVNELAAYKAKNAQKTILFTAENSGEVFHYEFENSNFRILNQTTGSKRIIVSGAWGGGSSQQTSVAYDPENHEVFIARRSVPLQLKRAPWNGSNWAVSQPLQIGLDSSGTPTTDIDKLANPSQVGWIGSLFFNTFDRKLYLTVTGGGSGSRILRFDPNSQSPQIELFVLLDINIVPGTVKMLDTDSEGNLYGTIVDNERAPVPSQRGIVMFQRFQQ